MSTAKLIQTSLNLELLDPGRSGPSSIFRAAQRSQIRNRVKTLAMGSICVLLFVSSGLAADSICLLGDDGKIAVTTFEHRTATSGRATDVTLIFGTHLLRGKLNDTDSGPITLKETSKTKENNYTFEGSIRVDYNSKKMTLKGKLKVADTEISNLNTTFRCKELQP